MSNIVERAEGKGGSESLVTKASQLQSNKGEGWTSMGGAEACVARPLRKPLRVCLVDWGRS